MNRKEQFIAFGLIIRVLSHISGYLLGLESLENAQKNFSAWMTQSSKFMDKVKDE